MLLYKNLQGGHHYHEIDRDLEGQGGDQGGDAAHFLKVDHLNLLQPGLLSWVITDLPSW